MLLEDKRFMDAADGWLMLGNCAEAYAELERISEENRTHPDVLRVRLQIHVHGKKWLETIELAHDLIKTFPDDPWLWIIRSFALHEEKRTEEAYDLLAPAARHFPQTATIPYNLACYCAQLGRLDEARKRLKQAFMIGEEGKSLKAQAQDDPDLAIIRSEISRL